MSFMFRDRKETDFGYSWETNDNKEIEMKQSLTYGVDIPWSQLVDFLDEKFVDLMCKRLHVNRERLARVPFIVSGSDASVLQFFNVVDLNA